MRYELWLAAGLLVVSGIACKKQEEASGHGAAIRTQSASKVVAFIDASQEQHLSVSLGDDLPSINVAFPPGSLSESTEVRLALATNLLFDGDPSEVFDLSEEVDILAQKPAFVLEPTDHSKAISLAKPVQITLSWSVKSGQQLNILGLQNNPETGARQITLQGLGAADADRSQIQFAISAFGAVQPFLTSKELPESRTGTIGTGRWWGYEIDLFAHAAQPSAGNVPLWEMLFMENGDITSFKINSQEIPLLPGSSFSVFVTDSPVVFDSSNNEALRPWVWSRRSGYGAMFTAAPGNQSLGARILQRAEFTEDFPPSGSMAGSDLAGDYTGHSVAFEAGSFEPTLPAFTDELTLTVTDGNLKLAGQLAGYESVEASLDWTSSSDPLAARLGLLQGDVALNSGDETAVIRLFSSLDRQAIGYVLCVPKDTAGCGDGAGGGSLDPYRLRYGMIEKLK
jgi:hypothetical protein